jgi:hypothetical protein
MTEKRLDALVLTAEVGLPLPILAGVWWGWPVPLLAAMVAVWVAVVVAALVGARRARRRASAD